MEKVSKNKEYGSTLDQLNILECEERLTVKAILKLASIHQIKYSEAKWNVHAINLLVIQ